MEILAAYRELQWPWDCSTQRKLPTDRERYQVMPEQDHDNLLSPSDSTVEPHFDDEQTILTARPVVPLELLDEKLKPKRRLFVVWAFAVAILLGGASGLASAYFKLRNAPDLPVAQTESDEPLASTVSESTLNEDRSASPSPVIEEPVAKLVLSKRVVKLRPVTRRINDSFKSQPLSEDEELLRIRQDILVDEWQGQVKRRAERRDNLRSERKRNTMIH